MQDACHNKPSKYDLALHESPGNLVVRVPDQRLYQEMVYCTNQIRTNNSLLFAGTIAFCSQGRCGSHAEITTKSSSKIVKFSAWQTFFLAGGGECRLCKRDAIFSGVPRGKCLLAEPSLHCLLATENTEFRQTLILRRGIRCFSLSFVTNWTLYPFNCCVTTATFI